MEPMIQKLIIWLLGALCLVMTTVGGSTASRLITQIDTVVIAIGDLKVNQAISETKRLGMEVELQRIETTLQRIEDEQQQEKRRGR